MESPLRVLFQDRTQAGKTLAKRLLTYRNTDTIVVAIPYGGVSVAFAIADELHLPLEIIPCRKIQHPSNSKRTIGSVTATEIFLHNCSRGIPQDYISRQIKLLREEIKNEIGFFYQNRVPTCLKGKTIIVVDDILENCDSLLSSVTSIKKQQPGDIIFACPVVAEQALDELKTEFKEMVIAQVVPEISLWDSFFIDSVPVTKDDVIGYLRQSRSKFEFCEATYEI